MASAEVATGADVLRQLLVSLLRGDQAHMSFEEAVRDFPSEAMNVRAPHVEYTPWHLVEHLRITQWDILEYIRDSRGHVSPPWPLGYWPDRDATTDADGFRASVDGYVADRAALEAIALDPTTDLLAVLPGTPGHTVFRELVVVGNHDSYHVGELGLMRQVMETWRRR